MSRARRSASPIETRSSGVRPNRREQQQPAARRRSPGRYSPYPSLRDAPPPDPEPPPGRGVSPVYQPQSRPRHAQPQMIDKAVQVGDSGLGRARRRADAAEAPASGISTPRAKNTSSSRRRVTAAQLAQLVAAFTNNEYPTTHERDALAVRLAMPSRSVQIWFQNRRRSRRVQERTARQLSRIDGTYGGSDDNDEDSGGGVDVDDDSSNSEERLPHKTSDVRNQ